MNRSGVIVITLLAVAAIVFAALYFTGNSDKANITGNLNDQIASLKADAAKAAKEASAELEAVKADAAKAAEEAAASLKAVTDEKDALTGIENYLSGK